MSRTLSVVVVLFACAAIACAGHSPCRAQVEAGFGGEVSRETEARPPRSVIVLVLPASMWAGDGSAIGPQGGAPIDVLALVMLDDTPYPMATSLPPLPKDGSVALGVVVYDGLEHKNATGNVSDQSRVGTPGGQVLSLGHLRWPMSEDEERAAGPGSRGVHEGVARGDVILTSRAVTYVPSPAGDAVLSPAEAMLRAGAMIESFADSERARLGSFAARRHVMVVLADEPGGHQWGENDRGGHDWAALASARDRLVCGPSA